MHAPASKLTVRSGRASSSAAAVHCSMHFLWSEIPVASPKVVPKSEKESEKASSSKSLQ